MLVVKARSHCFCEQETVPSVIGTGWFQVQIYLSKIAYFLIRLK